MDERVVVLGAGYAGCVAIQRLEEELSGANLTWVSEFDYHLVRHEVHRAISDPTVREKIAIPVSAIKSEETSFVQGRVEGLDTDARRIDLAGGGTIDYDYVLVALGSDTAFYGVPGVAERALTLDGIDDALAINEAVRESGTVAREDDPARVIVVGAGLSGVQAAGELAALGERERIPLRITVVEALDEILPGAAPTLQRRIRRTLESRDVGVMVDDPVTAVGPEAIEFDERSSIPYDVLVWTGGITGREALAGTTVENDHRRLNTDVTFRTSDDRVFAVGDAAIVGLDGEVAPPTAQAAWDGANIAAANVARRIDGRPLRRWTYRDKGTLISVGDEAVAHDVKFAPMETFGGPAAVFLKKLVAARWIATITSWRRGLAAWDSL